MSEIESLMHEDRVFAPPADFAKKAAVSGIDAYNALCAEVEKDYEGFWGRLARENLGVSVQADEIGQQVAKAKKSPQAEAAVKRLRLGIRSQGEDADHHGSASPRWSRNRIAPSRGRASITPSKLFGK